MKQEKSTSNLTEGEERRLRRWLWLFAVIIVLAGLFSMFIGVAKRTIQPPVTWKQILGPPASQGVDESKPLREQTARVELGDRVFNIPLMYIDSRPAPGRVYKDSVVLEVIWPDMRSIYELKDQQEYERISKQEQRIGWILVEPSALRPPLDEQTANRRLGLTKEEHAGTEAGLDKYLWYHGKPERPEIWAELYFEKDFDGHIITRIECRLGAGVLFPTCQHKFVDTGVIYELVYNKAAFFSDWREQRQRAIDFLRSFETTSSNQQQHGG